jgi:gas vesicle protein
MNDLIRSILKTAVYFLDQTDRFTGDVRDRVSDGVDRAASQVSSRVSDLREQAEDFYDDGDHTLRNVLTFAAGVGVGIGAALLFAPASGEEVRGQIGEKVQDISGRVRNRFSSAGATGTEGSAAY